MPDYSKLLKRPAAGAKKPPVLPIGDYPGVISRWEVGDNNQKKTPYVRFFMGLTGWPEDVNHEDTLHTKSDGTVEQIDLSKRQQRRDFFLTEDSEWRLHEFIASCGIESEGLEYTETLPKMVGSAVIIEVQQGINQNTSEPFNQVGKVVGAG